MSRAPSLRLVRRLTLAVALIAASSAIAAAQGSCFTSNAGTCIIGPNATYSFTITVPTAVQLSVPSGTFALGTATSAEFAAGFGTPLLVPVSVRANTPWTVTVRSTATLWTATPGTARQDKPVGDLQWALVAGGPYTNMTTTTATLGTGTATTLTSLSLYLRASLVWLVDIPGNYSVPVQLSITAP